MLKPFTHFGLLLAVVLASLAAGSAQTFFFPPSDRSTCSINGGSVRFEASFLVFSPTHPLPTDLSVSIISTSSTTLTLPALPAGASISTTTVIDGVNFEFIAGRGVPAFPAFYTFVLELTAPIEASLDGMGVQFIAEGAAPEYPRTGAAASLEIKEPIDLSIISPASNIITHCEGDTLIINGDVSRVPQSYEWLRNNSTVVKSGLGFMDFSIPTLALSDSANYRVRIYDDACPVATSEVINLFVEEKVVIVATDMTPKELAVGDTKTFTARANFVDLTSTYTWRVNGIDFTATTLPDTILVGGNSIQINSILNTPVGPTSVTSTLSLTNISDPGAPDFSAPVRLTVTNNAFCETSIPTVMSGATSAYFPVEWAAFTAQRKSDKDVLLAWQTATESNNEKFVVERSTNGRTFDAIGTVAGAGSSQSLQSYQWIDGQLPTASTLYYRIRQVDYDGQFSHSDVRTVGAVRGGSDWKISPVTLVGEQASVYLAGLDSQSQVTFRLFDARGVLVSSGSVPALVEGQAFTFLAPQQRGMYVLQVLADGEQVSRSFVR